MGTARGGFSITFGGDITKDFCTRIGVKSVIRSHQLPPKMRGFEIQHDSMLLTIFSASNYGGACRNKGGVLLFDEQGPAEVKEFYAPTLESLRAQFAMRAVEGIRSQLDAWKELASQGTGEEAREKRKEARDKQRVLAAEWKHIIVKVAEGASDLSAENERMIAQIEAAASDGAAEPPPAIGRVPSVIVGPHDLGRRRARARPRAADDCDRTMRRRTLASHIMRDFGSTKASEVARSPSRLRPLQDRWGRAARRGDQDGGGGAGGGGGRGHRDRRRHHAPFAEMRTARPSRRTSLPPRRPRRCERRPAVASTDSVTSGSEAARQVIGRRKASDPHPHPQPQPSCPQPTGDRAAQGALAPGRGQPAAADSPRAALRLRCCRRPSRSTLSTLRPVAYPQLRGL